MTGANLDIIGANETNLSGLLNTQFVFDGGAFDFSLFEVAGAAGGGFADNYAVDALTLGSGTSFGKVRLIDQRDNGNRGASGRESLFAEALSIAAGSYLDMHGYRLYLAGDESVLLDAYIAGNRLGDSTLSPGYYLDAVYDPAHSWTRVDVIQGGGALGNMPLLGSGVDDASADAGLPVLRAFAAFGAFPLGNGAVVPEPATILMLAFGLAGLAGIARRKIL
jgi:hypothetical protein